MIKNSQLDSGSREIRADFVNFLDQKLIYDNLYYYYENKTDIEKIESSMV